MAAPYIPSQDSALDVWSANFANLITAAPSTYGLDAVAAANIQGAVDAYHTAFLCAGLTAPPNPTPVNPACRTSVTIATKDADKLAMRTLCRVYASQIRLNPGVLNADKIALGLNLPNNSPVQIPAPITWPIFAFISAGPLSHILSYTDSTPGAGKAKPFGAVAALLFCGLATAATTDPDALPYNSSQTKSPLQLTFDPSAAGKIATYAARWVTRKGLVGPWGPIISTTVVGA